MNDDIMLSPSLMCADYTNLGKIVGQLEEAGATAFHIDVMDGKYVPNFGMSPQDITAIRKSTDLMLDVHLMIEDPLDYIDLFKDLGADLIYFHPDACVQPYQVLTKIKNAGLLSGIAISPGISVESLKPLIIDADYVLLMTVNPGFAGQNYIDSMNRKLEELHELQKIHGFKIVADGALSMERISSLIKCRVDGFVLGTSVLFKKEATFTDYESVFQSIKEVKKHEN